MTEQPTSAGQTDDLDLSSFYQALAQYKQDVQQVLETWGPSDTRPDNDYYDPTEMELALNNIDMLRQATEAELEEILHTRRPPDQESIQIGHRVTLQAEATGTTLRFLLLEKYGGEQVGANLRTLSLRSPVGRALLGHKKGESVTVQAPNGPVTYTVLTIE